MESTCARVVSWGTALNLRAPSHQAKGLEQRLDHVAHNLTSIDFLRNCLTLSSQSVLTSTQATACQLLLNASQRVMCQSLCGGCSPANDELFYCRLCVVAPFEYTLNIISLPYWAASALYALLARSSPSGSWRDLPSSDALAYGRQILPVLARLDSAPEQIRYCLKATKRTCCNHLSISVRETK